MTNCLFPDKQHGFLPGQSCVTQILVAIVKWLEALDQGLASCGCHLFRF